ncbi:MAG: redoxin domain-containing protein [Nitrospirales bacterium]|nr:redoxin domain-containing protein [Nitrospirales bacterium]
MACMNLFTAILYKNPVPLKDLGFKNMRRDMYRIASLVCIGLALLTWGCDIEPSQSPSLSSPQASAQHLGPPQVGAPAPNFTLFDLAGKPVSMSDMKGKGVLLNFWATWCGPCRVEMPGMENLYQHLQSKGFEILAISTDPQGTTVTQPFQEAYGLTFPILHDADYEVGTSYGVRTLPMSYLVDRHGIIRHQVFGAREWNSEKAHTLIEKLLSTASS